MTLAAVTGAVIDSRTGRLPNVLTASVAIAGVAAAIAGVHPIGVAAALGGAALGFALMLPGHLFGGTGAGDVKFLAALGTWLGPRQILTAFLVSAIAGGVLALAHAWRRGRIALTLSRTAGLITAPGVTRDEVNHASSLTRFAYGPAIALGAVAAAFWR